MKAFQLPLLFVIICCVLSCTSTANKKDNAVKNKEKIADSIKLLVGTYTSDASKGIYSLEFNIKNGELTHQSLLVESENPSFLAQNSTRDFVYAVNENDPGRVSSFTWNETKTKLIEVSKLSSGGVHPCFIALSTNNDLVAMANYSSGSIGVYSVENGIITGEPQIRTHSKNSIINPEQTSPHAHCSKFSKDGAFLYVADLGIDEIVGYPLDENNELKKSFTALKMDVGDGPRHFVFHPNKELVYIINELSSAVTVAEMNTITGVFTVIDKQSTLPSDFVGTSYCADIHMSSDGKYLYASNRGHNSIATFSVADNGTIKLIDTESVQGDWPRNFTLSPNGKFLVVANQKSDNITVFEVNKATGLLTFTGVDYKMSKPVSLMF